MGWIDPHNMPAAGYDIFLSYSRTDAAASDRLRARLADAGLNAFQDSRPKVP